MNNVVWYSPDKTPVPCKEVRVVLEKDHLMYYKNGYHDGSNWILINNGNTYAKIVAWTYLPEYLNICYDRFIVSDKSDHSCYLSDEFGYNILKFIDYNDYKGSHSYYLEYFSKENNKNYKRSRFEFRDYGQVVRFIGALSDQYHQDVFNDKSAKCPLPKKYEYLKYDTDNNGKGFIQKFYGNKPIWGVVSSERNMKQFSERIKDVISW